MKRNTYVTATLFVVFGLLTLIYMNMGDNYDPEIPAHTSVGAPRHLMVDAQNDAEKETDESKVDEEVAQINEQNEDHEENQADSEVANVEEDCEDCEEEMGREVISRLDAMRADLEVGHAQQVSALTSIIASADTDARIKSDAKDTLNSLQTFANSSRVLETVIGHRGFDDVLVHATADFVRITVQVTSNDDIPTLEELAELYVLAGIEFGNHRGGNISIDFQPLN